MTRYATVLGSLKTHEKGRLALIDDLAKRYCHSNVFDVASKSKPWEKVAVACNLEYVIECIRAEGNSPWYTATHDEFVVVMDGQVTLTLHEASGPPPSEKDGTQLLGKEPTGKRMGRIHLKRGHQALLAKGVAYRFTASTTSVMIQQTIAGELTLQRWAQICTR